MVRRLSETFMNILSIMSWTTSRPQSQDAPIFNLPHEILIHIFQLSSQTICVSRPRMDRSPISLTHVCKLWRDVAIDASELWTSYSVGEFMLPKQQNESVEHKVAVEDGNVELGKLFVGRAKNRLLDIMIRIPNRGLVSSFRQWGEIQPDSFWTWLFGTAPRWRTLVIKCTPINISLLINHLQYSSQLQSLTIFDGGLASMALRPPTPDYAFWYEIAFSPGELQHWTSLKIFNVSNYWLLEIDLLEFLRCLTTVEVVQAKLFPGSTHLHPQFTNGNPPLITQQSLRKLELITSGHLLPILTVINSLNVPNLTHLTLKNCDKGSPPLSFSSSNLTSFYSRNPTINRGLLVTLKGNFISDDLSIN